MQAVTTIGLDIAKSVFQVHGVDAAGNVTVRRQLRRRNVLAFFQKVPACLVGIEACATSHHWSREITALGHTVRLMPPGRGASKAMEAQSPIGSPSDWRTSLGRCAGSRPGLMEIFVSLRAKTLGSNCASPRESAHPAFRQT